jgi:hypothetical protein
MHVRAFSLMLVAEALSTPPFLDERPHTLLMDVLHLQEKCSK